MLRSSQGPGGEYQIIWQTTKRDVRYGSNAGVRRNLTRVKRRADRRKRIVKKKRET